MKLTLDTDARTVTLEEAGNIKTLDMYTREAFEAISRQWIRIGWNQKYPYTFSWMGRPVIQLPEDMIRMQEVIFTVKPDVIIETGVAHGGSLIYYSSLCKAMEKGRIIGIDIEIRPHNRAAIESHSLYDRIQLIEGSSTAPEIVSQVKALVKPGETVLVILDSNHTYAHVYDELEAYADLVTPGSYIVATDGVMKDVADVPRGTADWTTNNPTFAARDFAEKHTEFVIEQPAWPFNESELAENITHWPGAWLKRV
ncbi:hydroxylase [Metarhizobium album]|uniref:Hydroxylase n=1 Tax=Metarhizobium album TaxID=2182425 RepID=A0A2U2DWX6_9HYPH|nr:CmcI family methyltransferase [Rhizobium album]PWE57719.1 hydroxylase [Rhizobium album]